MNGRKVFICMGLMAILAGPAFSDWRFDLGFDVPRGLGTVADSGLKLDKNTADALNNYIFPFPEVGAHYQFGLGPAHMGVGVRLFTFILETVFWPNLIAEFDLSPIPLVLEGQLGGLFFGGFGLASFSYFGQVFIPDLSGWLKLGDFFRLGIGGTGIMLPEMPNIVFVWYIGAKVVVGK